MIRQNKVYFIIFIILSIASTILIIQNNKKSTIKAELKDFAIDDTSTINKVFIADKSNRTLLLTREMSGEWMVNNKFYARQDMVANMMDLLKRVKVKSPVAEAGMENVIKRMASNSIKVEIYQNNKLSKVFYVGGPTQDMTGTYMLIENSSVPFINFLPGHRGYLSNFFLPIETEWIDRRIFTYNIDDIKSITFEYPLDPTSSLKIEVLGRNEFKIKALETGKYLTEFDTNTVKNVLREFRNIACETFIELPSEQMDSIRAKYHLFTVSVENTQGIIRSVRGYEIPLPPGTIDAQTNEIVRSDRDRMYADINGKEQQAIIQYYTFDRITLPLSEYFYKR